MSEGHKLLGAYDLAQKVGFPVLLGVAGFLLLGHVDQGERLIKIEASRYTVNDARSDRETANRERTNLREILVRMDERTKNIETNLGKLTQAVEQRLQKKDSQ